MGLLFTIAWLNILRHKGRSFVVGIILFFGALVMTVGNGVVSGMDRGIREHIVKRFTGHIVIVSTNQKFDMVITTPFGKTVLPLSGYTNVKSVLEGEPFVARHLPMAKGMAFILSESGSMGRSSLIGVEFDKYREFFGDNSALVEGKYLRTNERGLLVTTVSRETIFDTSGFWIVPEGGTIDLSTLSTDASNADALTVKNDVVLMGFSDDGALKDVRVPVRGVFRYRELNKLWEFMNIVDIESFRECFNYVSASAERVVLAEDTKKALAADSSDLSSLLDDSSVVAVDTKAQPLALKKTMARSIPPISQTLDSGGYTYVSVMLKDGISVEDAAKRIDADLRKKGADGRAVPWYKAAGSVADFAVIIRASLFGFVAFIFFVAVIIIMNTLSMAAMERTNEIGMMRAVGASRGFTGGMFTVETVILSAAFGGGGIIAGALVTVVLTAMRITTGNEMIQLAFGGDVFRPLVTAGDLAVCVVMVAVVTLASVIYPVIIARRITPLDAIARD